jgi:hypothetical protein
VKTEIAVEVTRFTGARLKLHRSDGCCMSLDVENEVCISNAQGSIIRNFGIITDAKQFLEMALEFSGQAVVEMQPKSSKTGKNSGLFSASTA